MSRKKCQININSLGGRLRTFRESKDINIVEFSKLLDISHSSLSSIENNKSRPSATPIENLLRKFDINIYWLFTGRGKMIRDEKVLSIVRDVKPETEHDIPKQGHREAAQEDICEQPKGRAGAVSKKEPGEQELLDKTYDVLISGTGYATALTANIEAFHNAIKTDERNDIQNNKLAKQDGKLKSLKEECSDLKARLSSMETQIADILKAKETPREDPPEETPENNTAAGNKS